MIKNDKLKLIDILVLMTISSVLFLVFTNKLPIGIRSFRFLWAPLMIGVVIIIRPKLIFKTPVSQLCLYGFLSVFILQYSLWIYMSEWNKSRIVNEFYDISVFLLILGYYFLTNRLTVFAKISRISLFFIIITAIMTYIALIIDPTIVRNSAAGYLGDSRQIYLSDKLGSGGYGYVQALIIFMPLLVYHIKKNKRLVISKNGLWLLLILIILITLKAQVFANILAMLITLLLSFAGSKRRKAMYRYVILIVFFFIIIPDSMYIDLLRAGSQYFPKESETYYKLNDFAIFIENPELDNSTGAGSRVARYPLMLEALVAKPFFGDASYESNLDIDAGGHLYWMNKLAILGIFGFYIYIYTLYKIYKFIDRKITDSEMKFYYFLSVLSFMILGLMKNSGGREIWVFLIIVIPGLFLGTLEDMEQDRFKTQKINKDKL